MVLFETITASHCYARSPLAAHDALGDAEAAAGALVSALRVSAPTEEGEVAELAALSSKVLGTLAGKEQVGVFLSLFDLVGMLRLCTNGSVPVLNKSTCFRTILWFRTIFDDRHYKRCNSHPPLCRFSHTRAFPSNANPGVRRGNAQDRDGFLRSKLFCLSYRP